MLILPGVYEPREDTMLLLSALPASLKGKRCLDMGTGTGIVGIEMAKRGGDVTFVDVSPTAVLNARLNARLAGVKGKFIISDLFEKVPGTFDVVTFNPPYLPPEGIGDAAVEDNGIIDKFLNQLPQHLERSGVAYIVVSSLSTYTIPKNLVSNIVAKKHLFFEDLYVLEVKHAA